MKKRNWIKIKKSIATFTMVCFLNTNIFAVTGGIIINGRTDTRINQHGNTINVYTNTVKNNNAYNAFSQFDVYSDQNVNLYLPDSSSNLMNLIYDKRSNIDGILNSYQNGKIGGNVFFLNPYGFSIGKDGVINTGSLFMYTPDREFLDGMINSSGNISDMYVNSVLEGDIPVDELGLISIDGSVKAKNNIEIKANNVEMTGNMSGFMDTIVNTDFINIKAENDINLKDGSKIDASSQENGGDVYIYAGNKALLSKGSEIVSGGKTGGDIEFSAGKVVELAGGTIDATGSEKDGNILIDPEEINITENVFMHGENKTLIADELININDGVTISTRKVDGSSSVNVHKEGNSTGDSGNISMEADTIFVGDNANILSQADSGYNSGDISLNAEIIEIGTGVSIDASNTDNTKAGNVDLTAYHNFDGPVSITESRVSVGENTSIKGKDITISSNADSTTFLDEDYAGVEKALDMLDMINLLPVAYAYSKADSKVELKSGVDIDAQGSIFLSSRGKTEAKETSIGWIANIGWGETNTFSKVIVDGATLNAENNVSIDSDADTKIAMSSIAMSFGGTKGEAAFTYGNADVINNIDISGSSSITSGGNISVNADTFKSQSVSAGASAYQDGELAASFAWSKSNIDNKAQVGGTLKGGNVDVNSNIYVLKNHTSSTSQVGTSGIMQKTGIIKAFTAIGGLKDAFTKKFTNITPKTRPESSKSSFAFGAAGALTQHENISQANIKSDSDVEAQGDVDVYSAIKASEDADDQDDDDYEYNNIKQITSSIIDSNPLHQKSNSVSTAINISSFNNKSKAYIGENADVDSKGSIDVKSKNIKRHVFDWLTSWELSDIMGKLNPTLGVQHELTTWSRSAADSAQGSNGITLAGSLSFVDFDYSSDAYIDKNAKINQDSSFRSGNQQVEVKSSNYIDNVHLSGALGLTLFGSTGEKGGMGGAYLQVDDSSNSYSGIKTGADVYGDSVIVESKSFDKGISIAASGTKSQGYGLAGSYSYRNNENTIISEVQEGADIEVGNSEADADFAGKSTVVNAQDYVQVLNISGSVLLGKASGIGFSGGHNNINRDIIAGIGIDRDGEIDLDGSFISSSDAYVRALGNGEIKNFSIAGSIKTPTDTEPGKSSVNGSKYGFGISGDMALNNVSDNISSSVENVDYSGNSLDVISNENTDIFSVAGSATIASGASLGLSGSVSINNVKNEVLSGIKNSDVDLESDLNVNSESEGKIDAWAVSSSIGMSATGKSIKVAGSVSINSTENTVESSVENSDITTNTGSIDVHAWDTSEISVKSGVLSAGVGSGIGAVVATNKIVNTVKTESIDSDLTAAGDIDINSNSYNKLENYAVSAGVSAGDLAASTAVSVNYIGNTVGSEISGKKENGLNTSSGYINVKATENYDEVLDSGSLGGAQKAGFGVNVTTNKLENTLYSKIKDTFVQDSVRVVVNSDSKKNIQMISAGAAAAGYVAAAGSVITNSDHSTVDSYIENTDIDNTAMVSVNSYSDIYSDLTAGSLSASWDGIAIGGSVVVNNSDVKMNNYVKDSDISSSFLNLYSEKYNIMDVLSINVGAANTGALASNVIYSKIEDSNISKIEGSEITVDNISNKVKSHNELDSSTDSTALSATASIGAANTDFIVKDTTKAYIDNTNVYENTTLLNRAFEISNFYGLNIGGSLSGEGALAGVVTYVLYDNQLESYIEDSNISSSDVTVKALCYAEVGDKDAEYDVDSDGNVDLTMDGDYFLNGSLAIGAAGGVGASVGVTSITNSTKAYLKDTVISNNSDTNIDADSVNKIKTFTAAGAGGEYLGVGSSTLVNNIQTETYAYTTEDDGETKITGGNVNITADSINKIETIIGSGGGGAVGAGASVDVTTIRSKVKARSGNNTEIIASNNLNIKASEDDSIYSKVVGAAGGVVALGGGVGIYSIGASHSEKQSEAMQTTGEDTDDQIQSSTDVDNSLVGEGMLPELPDFADLYADHKEDSTPGFSIMDAFSQEDGDSSYVYASIGDNANVRAGNILVDSKSDYTLDSLTGGAALGNSGVGAGIGLLETGNNTSSYIGKYSEIEADTLDINAKSDLNLNDFTSFAGAAGVFLTMGASVTGVKNSNNTSAYIDNNALIKRSDTINIISESNTNGDITSYGAAVGTGAIGLSFSNFEKNGETKSYLGDNVVVGEIDYSNSVKDINIEAGGDSNVNTLSVAGAAGIYSGSGAVSQNSYYDNVYSYTGENVKMYTSNDVNIKTDSNVDVSSQVDGVSVGYTLAAGVSKADTYIFADNQSYIGKNNMIYSDDVRVYADSVYNTNADSLAASGALIGINGALSFSKIEGQVIAEIGMYSVINTDDDIRLHSVIDSTGNSIARGFAAGMIAAGGTYAQTVDKTYSAVNVKDNVKLKSGDSVDVEVNNEKEMKSETLSGSGGLIAGTASRSELDDNSVAEVNIGKVKIYSDDVSIDNVNKTTFNSYVDTIKAAGIGVSGSVIKNEIDSEANINFTGFYTETENFVVNSGNYVYKPWLDIYNSNTGSGGVVDAPASRSDTYLNADSTINLQGSELNITGDRLVSGDFSIKSTTKTDAEDRSRIVSGGVIPIAKAVNNMIENTYNKINISGTKIDSVADLSIATVSDSDVKTKVMVSTYGLSSVAQGSSRAEVNNINRINIEDSTDIKAKNVFIGTGIDSKGEVGRYKARSYTDLFNNSALPFTSDPEAVGELDQDYKVYVDTSSAVKSIQDISIETNEGYKDIIGKGKALNTYDEALSRENIEGDAIEEYTSRVKIDGNLNAGVDNVQKIHFDQNGNVIDKTDGIDYEIEVKNLAESINDEIDRLEDLRNDYADLPAAYNSYTSRINELKKQLAALDAIDNDEYIEKDMSIIKVSDVIASSGNIHINSDNLYGSGNIVANPYAKIQIINDSTKFLNVENLIIPDIKGGNLYYNYADIYTNDAINSRNLEDSATFTRIQAANDSVDTLIEVKNTYDPDLPGNDGIAPGLDITGDIQNLNGIIRIHNIKGDIVTTGNIAAKTIDINSGGDFVQGYTEGFTHIGGNPSESDYWQGIADYSEDKGTDRQKNYNLFPDSDSLSNGSIISGNNVFIAGRYLNINGLVQSGLPDKELNIAADFKVMKGWKILTPQTAINDYKNHKIFDERLPILGAGSIKAYLNLKTGIIEVEDVRVEGGHMELSGQILNTGGTNGQLKVLDGYGRVNITNNSDYNMVVNDVILGEHIEGYLKITDTAKTNISGDILSTVYLREGTNVNVYNNDTVDEFGNPDNLISSVSGRDSSYNPLDNQRYVWITGLEHVIEKTKKWEHNSWLGWDSIIDDDYLEYSTTKNLSTESLLEGEMVEINSNPYEYYYDKTYVTVSDYVRTYNRKWTTETWWGKKTYHVKRKYKKGTKTYNEHSIMADYPIGIEFIGYDNAEVDIASNGILSLNGLIDNIEGNTTLTSNDSIKNLSDDTLVSTTNIDMTSVNGIGDDRKIIVDTASDGYINAVNTSGDIFIENRGKSIIKTITTNSGNINFISDTDILAFDSNSSINGDNISVESSYGNVGTSDSFIKMNALDQNEYGVSVTAKDSIYIERSQAGDMGLNKIYSKTGDVSIKNNNGGIYDANTNDTRDTRTEDELLSLWSDMSLREEDGALARADVGVDSYKLSKNQDYFFYWKYRNRQEDATSFDPTFNAEFTSSEKDSLKDSGYTDSEILAMEEENTNKYRALNQEFEQTEYSEDYDYVVSDQEIESLKEGAVWNESQLRNTFVDLGKAETASTQLTVEEANITGNNVNIVASTGVGSEGDDVVIDLSDGHIFTDQEKLALMSAESQDLVFSEDKSNVTVRSREDVDIHGASIDISTSGHVYLGGEEDINISRIQAGLDKTVRIKGKKGIYNVSITDNPVITAGSLVLEASDGTIGTAEKAMLIDLSNGGFLTARSSGNIYINETQGDMNISYFYTPQDVFLESAGNIYNYDGDLTDNIRADNIYIDSTGSFGESSNRINLNLDGSVNVNSGSDIYIASLSNIVSLGNIQSTGNIDLLAGNNVNMADQSSINAVNAVINSSGAIGNDQNYINVESGNIDFTGSGDVKVKYDQSSSTGVSLQSNTSNVYIKSDNSYNFNDDVTAENGFISVVSSDQILKGNGTYTSDNIMLSAKNGIGYIGDYFETSLNSEYSLYSDNSIYFKALNSSVLIKDVNTAKNAYLYGVDELNTTGNVNASKVYLHAQNTVKTLSGSVINSDYINAVSEDSTVGTEDSYLNINSPVIIASAENGVFIKKDSPDLVSTIISLDVPSDIHFNLNGGTLDLNRLENVNVVDLGENSNVVLRIDGVEVNQDKTPVSNNTPETIDVQQDNYIDDDETTDSTSDFIDDVDVTDNNIDQVESNSVSTDENMSNSDNENNNQVNETEAETENVNETNENISETSDSDIPSDDNNESFNEESNSETDNNSSLSEASTEDTGNVTENSSSENGINSDNSTESENNNNIPSESEEEQKSSTEQDTTSDKLDESGNTDSTSEAEFIDSNNNGINDLEENGDDKISSEDDEEKEADNE